MKFIALTIITLLAGCATQDSISKLNDITNIKSHIHNEEDTLYWVYCGKTEKDQIILKRVDGTSDVSGCSYAPVIKIENTSWYLIEPDMVEFKNDINPGTRLMMMSSEERASLSDIHLYFTTQLKLANREFSKCELPLIDATE